jgi:hypothetical protein
LKKTVSFRQKPDKGEVGRRVEQAECGSGDGGTGRHQRPERLDLFQIHGE